MRKILEFTLRHSRQVILVTIIATGLMVYTASTIKMNPEIDALMPENKRLNDLIEKYDPENQEKNLFLLALEVKGELSVEGLQRYEQVIDEINDLTGGFSNSIFSAVTFSKKGRRLAPAPLLPNKRAPQTADELLLFKENLKNDLFSKDVFFANEGKSFNTLFFHPKLSPESIMESYKEIIQKLDPFFITHSTGTIFLNHQSSIYLSQDLFKLLLLSLVAILIFYYIGFRSKRALFLPILIVLMGTIWSLGFMGLLGYEITMISIVIPPLVLTIGTSYTIHFLNQYYHDASVDHDNKLWIIEASIHVNKTIIMAAITTVIGFMSLLLTSMDASKEFGMATSIGIIACALLSMIFLPAALSRMKTPNHLQKKRIQQGKFTTAMGSISDIVYKRRILFTLLFFLIGAVFFITYPKITHQSDYVSYFPEEDPAVQSLSYIMDNFAGVQRLNLTIKAPENSNSYFLDPENLLKISLLEKKLLQYDDVMKISSFPGIIRDLNLIMSGNDEIPESRGLMLLMSKYFKALSDTAETGVSTIMANEEFSRINLTIMIYNSRSKAFLSESGLRDLIESIESDTENYLPQELNFDLWGFDLEFLDLAENVSKDQRLSTLIAIFLVFIISAFFFKSFIYGIVTLIPLLSGLMLNMIFMVILKIPLDITTMMVSSVAIGVGV
ncbi:MAG: MMPL family transporter, partial [Spirochaetaceae bacterium]|nr:MMPL family transporter [Spirochaetaceae bacterium]